MNPLLSNKKPILVMGGAPSLPSDLDKVKHLDLFKISANYHAVSQYACDLIAFVDWGIKGVRMDKILQQYNTPTVAPHRFATHFWPLRSLNPINTGVYSAWIAASTGCDVILAGIEFYQSPGKVYFDDSGADVRTSNKQPMYFTNCAAKLKQCGPGKVYALSGPLLNIIPKYELI